MTNEFIIVAVLAAIAGLGVNLIDIANDISEDYLKKAGDSISKFCNKEGILIPTIEPRVKLILSEENNAKLLLKMPVDNKKVGDIEQILYRKYLNQIRKDNEVAST